MANFTTTKMDLQFDFDNKNGIKDELSLTNSEPSTSNDFDNAAEKVLKGKGWCRLCMTDEDLNYTLSDMFDERISIIEAIRKCIPILMVRERDELSKKICTKCINILKQYYKFREICLEKDRIQKATVSVKNKRKCVSSNYFASKSRKVEISELKRREIDEKFDKIEAELRKTVEGVLSSEDETSSPSTENIIIEVHDDSELTEDETEHQKINLSDIKLPKGIRIKGPIGKFHSKLGKFPSEIIEGIDGNLFCLADKYLYEFRLAKGAVRYLKCVLANCSANAHQNQLENGQFEDKVIVKICHNHPALSEEDLQKQMFLKAMKKKMQTDKMSNFKSVYEELCNSHAEFRTKLPLRSVINEICQNQLNHKTPSIYSFEHFYDNIEDDSFQKLHFTHTNKQFYQEKFTTSDGCMALVFANCDSIQQVSDSKIMYVDASFQIDTNEEFKYHLVTVLVWVEDSYYPILFALINEKSQDIYKAIFAYLRDTLAPNLQPKEIVTDYEAGLYYALGETYLNSNIGGSVFYYTQNMYKKICSLNLSSNLETNSCFRNIYHMILMLPLLPVNTILDGLTNIKQQAKELDLEELTKPIFEHVREQWIDKVTPDLFCVHRLENRINENVIAPFKKLRDFLMLTKGKMQKSQITIVSVVEKLIELENFLLNTYSASSKRSFARDLSSSQKKNVLRAWQFIESHPKININNFFTKVLGYIKCMENQLWIWGFYRYSGSDTETDELINATNFSIINSEEVYTNNDHDNYAFPVEENVVLDVVVDQNDGFLIKGNETVKSENDDYIKYVNKS